MEQRRRQTTIAQLTLLVEYLEKHKDLALGRVRSKEARAFSSRLWRECSIILNAEGPARTGKEWVKVWNDLKSRVRAKLVAINSSHQKTGGGPSTAPSLTPLEERIANILGRDVGPLPNVRQDPFAINEINIEESSFRLIEESNLLEPESEIYSIPEEDVIAAPESAAHENATHKSAVHENAAHESAAHESVAHHDHSATCESTAHRAAISPSEAGQTPQARPHPTSTRDRVRSRQRQQDRRAAARLQVSPPPAQSNRNVLEESRRMILNIEKMKAEAALITAQGFKLLAESVDRFTRQYTRQAEASPRHENC